MTLARNEKLMKLFRVKHGASGSYLQTAPDIQRCLLSLSSKSVNLYYSGEIVCNQKTGNYLPKILNLNFKIIQG